MARLLSLRNALFLACAPLDEEQPNTRRFALALACAYGEEVKKG